MLVESRAIALREKLCHTQIDLRCSLSPLLLVNPSKKVEMKIWQKNEPEIAISPGNKQDAAVLKEQPNSAKML